MNDRNAVLSEPLRPRRACLRRSGQRRLVLHPPSDAVLQAAPAHWDLYARVMQHARRNGVRFAVGGGMATSFYTGMWRPTKDIDLYVLPEDRDAAIAATRSAGMQDYFEQQPYDRGWIYRAVSDGVIVDVIWAMANGCGAVEAQWLDRGAVTGVLRTRFALLAPEELVVTKLHVLQRDRCDWPDLLNVLYAAGPVMDWERLLRALAHEERLLASLVLMFSWLAPGRAAQFPPWLWHRLRIAPPDAAGPVRDQGRIERLDTRPWFTPILPA
jgi:hypothetical protein